MSIENAEIVSADVLVEDHDILTFDVRLKIGAWHMTFGGYCMDEHVHGSRIRAGGFYGPAILRQLMDVVGARSVSALKGKYLRVKTEGPFHGIEEIGHITEDRWFSPKQVVEELKKHDPKGDDHV